MSDGYHGRWCGSRTWRTKCPTCQAAVFFFSCGCGCKVFFDALGRPWLEHWCEIAAARQKSNDFETVATSVDPILQRWRDRIDEQVAERWRRRESKQHPDPIVAVAPRRGSPRELVGILREVMLEVDPLKEFGLGATTMSRVLLGHLGRGPVAKVVIHVPASDADEIESYVIWVPRVQAKTVENARGLSISVTVRMEAVGRDNVWWAETLGILRPERRPLRDGDQLKRNEA